MSTGPTTVTIQRGDHVSRWTGRAVLLVVMPETNGPFHGAPIVSIRGGDEANLVLCLARLMAEVKKHVNPRAVEAAMEILERVEAIPSTVIEP